MQAKQSRIWPGTTGFWVIAPKLLGPFPTKAAAEQAKGGRV